MDNLYIKTKDNNSLYIPIKDKISVITGNSASGKTKMINWLIACKKVIKYNPNEIIECSTNLDDIEILTNENDIKALLDNKYNNKIIFIDRLNLYITEQLLDYMRDSKNIYIVTGHRNISEITGQDAVLGMKHDGKNYICYLIYENGLMKPTELI